MPPPRGKRLVSRVLAALVRALTPRRPALAPVRVRARGR